MLPIGPLMREHRLIERMTEVIKSELTKMRERTEADPSIIDGAVDFFRTYADRCHHGKEEHILFKELAAKQLSEDDRKIMDELIEEHGYARKVVGKLSEAKTRFVQGNEGVLDDIEAALRELIQFYPKHIEKEDKHFFYPCMEYFATMELDAILQSFWEFDRNMIHEKYERMVTDREKKMDTIHVAHEQGQKRKCIVCGYIYDPEKGDPDHGIDPGTSFDQLPEDWVCPICLAPKKNFEEI